jgi:lysophospholipase L1-like esterase
MAATPGILVANPLSGERTAPCAGRQPEQGFRFVLQGDSVTWWARESDAPDTDPRAWGTGYAAIIGKRLTAAFPQHGLAFYNRGVSQNRVYDLQNRWNNDVLQLKPGLLSILIGVNHRLEDDFAAFETTYRQLLETTRAQLPGVVFVLGLPFIAPVGEFEENYERYRADIDRRDDIVKRIAADFDAVTVDYPALFDKAAESTPYSHLIYDGLHPTPAGYELMANEWIRVVGERLPCFKEL